jgi:hypothetical protein
MEYLDSITGYPGIFALVIFGMFYVLVFYAAKSKRKNATFDYFRHNSIGLIMMAIVHLNFIASLLGTEYSSVSGGSVGVDAYNRIGIVFFIFGLIIWWLTHLLQEYLQRSQVFNLDVQSRRRKSSITGETYTLLRDRTFLSLVSHLNPETAKECGAMIGEEFGYTLSSKTNTFEQYIREWNTIDSNSDWFRDVEFDIETNILKIRGAVARICREGIAENCNKEVICDFFRGYTTAVLEQNKEIEGVEYILDNCKRCDMGLADVCLMKYTPIND